MIGRAVMAMNAVLQASGLIYGNNSFHVMDNRTAELVVTVTNADELTRFISSAESRASLFIDKYFIGGSVAPYSITMLSIYVPSHTWNTD